MNVINFLISRDALNQTEIYSKCAKDVFLLYNKSLLFRWMYLLII